LPDFKLFWISYWIRFYLLGLFQNISTVPPFQRNCYQFLYSDCVLHSNLETWPCTVIIIRTYTFLWVYVFRGECPPLTVLHVKQWQIFRLKWTWEQCNWRQVVIYFITYSIRTIFQCGIFLLVFWNKIFYALHTSTRMLHATLVPSSPVSSSNCARIKMLLCHDILLLSLFAVSKHSSQTVDIS
jgi:hypothetical protein